MYIVEHFQFVLQLQIFESPDAPKNQVQLPPNPTKKENLLYVRCVPIKFNFTDLIIYRILES